MYMCCSALQFVAVSRICATCVYESMYEYKYEPMNACAHLYLHTCYMNE